MYIASQMHDDGFEDDSVDDDDGNGDDDSDDSMASDASSGPSHPERFHDVRNGMGYSEDGGENDEDKDENDKEEDGGENSGYSCKRSTNQKEKKMDGGRRVEVEKEHPYHTERSTKSVYSSSKVKKINFMRRRK